MRRNLILAGLCLALLFVPNTSAFAAETGVTVIEQEKETQETAEKQSWEDGDEEEPYFTEGQFAGYYQTLKKKIDSGTDNGMAAIKLYLLLIGGSVSEEDVRSVLEDGYLTEYISDFKSAGTLSEDYLLPKEVDKKPVTVPMDGEPTAALPGHDYGGITEYAENALKLFSSDDIERNAYINIPETTDQTTISGETISFTYFNMEPFDINFLSGSGYASVNWHFANMVLQDDLLVDLKVEHDEEHIRFFLGDATLPYSAAVSIKMESPNTRYNAYGENGTFRETYITDKNGYLVMNVTSDADSVTLAKEVVSEKIDTASVSNAAAVHPEQVEEPSMSGLRNVDTVTFVIAMALLALAWHAEWRNRK
ncbi:MAG: hypothetical protein LUE86_08210 [Clostridiales bacterium]|nr:hypothetical protein [Clostridiales bacterium]